MPSKQSMSYLSSFQYTSCGHLVRSYLFAGISIFNCGGSCLPSTMGRSVVDVYHHQSSCPHCTAQRHLIHLHQARFLAPLSICVVKQNLQSRTEFEAKLVELLGRVAVSLVSMNTIEIMLKVTHSCPSALNSSALSTAIVGILTAVLGELHKNFSWRVRCDHPTWSNRTVYLWSMIGNSNVGCATRDKF